MLWLHGFQRQNRDPERKYKCIELAISEPSGWVDHGRGTMRILQFTPKSMTGVVVCLGERNSNESPRDARRPNSWWKLGMSSKTVKDLTAGTAGGICQVSTLIQHAPFRLYFASELFRPN